MNVMLFVDGAKSFQFTRPQGARPRLRRTGQRIEEFQFTRPQGARRVARRPDRVRQGVSIHAPARGATLPVSSLSAHAGFQFTRPQGARPADAPAPIVEREFQFTRPQGARPSAIGHDGVPLVVSIHAPARGATADRMARVSDTIVSIHAPARGATGEEGGPDPSMMFQFTRPQGARLDGVWRVGGAIVFQFTRPQGARR